MDRADSQVFPGATSENSAAETISNRQLQRICFSPAGRVECLPLQSQGEP
jgi:hypothetical protein